MGRLFRTAVLVWRREEEGDENKGLGGEKAKDWLGRKAEFYIENRGSEYRGRTCREMDARCPPASSEIQSLVSESDSLGGSRHCLPEDVSFAERLYLAVCTSQVRNSLCSARQVGSREQEFGQERGHTAASVGKLSAERMSRDLDLKAVKRVFMLVGI